MCGTNLQSATSWQAYERALKETNRMNSRRIAALAEEKNGRSTPKRSARS